MYMLIVHTYLNLISYFIRDPYPIFDDIYLKTPKSKLVVLQKKNVKSIEFVYWIDEYKFKQ